MKSALKYFSFMLLASGLGLGSAAHAAGCPDLAGTYAVPGGSNAVISQTAADTKGFVTYVIFGDKYVANIDGSVVKQDDGQATARCVSDRLEKGLDGNSSWHADVEEITDSSGNKIGVRNDGASYGLAGSAKAN